MTTGLLLSDPLFYRVFHDSPVSMVITTLTEGRFVEVNRAYADLLGYEPEELLGQTFPMLSLVHEEERNLVMEVLRRAGKLADIPFLLRTRQGEIKTAIGSVQMEEIDGDVYLVAMLQDLTEYDRVQNALLTAEARFRTFFQGIPLPVIVFDAQSLSILDVNPAACRAYGYTHDQFTRLTMASLSPPDDLPRLRAKLAGLAESGPTPMGIWRHMRHDADAIDVDIVTYAFDLEGRGARLAIVQDITAQLATNRALRASEERLRLVADVTTDAIWDRELNSEAVEWNHGLGSLFGFSLADARPHDWWLQQIHPDERDEVNATIDRVFQSDENYWTAEYRFRRADGEYVNVVDRGYVIRDEAGRPVRFIGAMVDITGQLAVAEAAARATQEERQRLARDLHEAVTQSLYSTSLMAEAAQRHARANQLAASLDYVTRLSDLSRQALRQLRLLVYQLRPKMLEQEGLIAALRYRLDAVEKRAGIQTKLIDEADHQMPLTLQTELFWIAQEALDNSLKHANASKTTVTVRTVGNEVWLEVSDNGRGFADDGALHSGAGFLRLGERVDRLGGTLEIESRPGEGALVRARVELGNSQTGAFV